jgi:hypothetical protein
MYDNRMLMRTFEPKRKEQGAEENCALKSFTAHQTGVG